MNAIPHVALAGNPNSGKSTLFNALTGLRQKIANYPGVTVEKKVGTCRLAGEGSAAREVNLIDLPGAYSLSPRSPDEEITHDVIFGNRLDTPPPDVIVAVVDANNLERNLFFASQLFGTGKPVVLALNMMDLAEKSGLQIDPRRLAELLGVTVVPIVASEEKGLDQLRFAILRLLQNPNVPARTLPLKGLVEFQVRKVAQVLVDEKLVPDTGARGEALRLISSTGAADHPRYKNAARLQQSIQACRDNLAGAHFQWHALEAEARYAWIENVLSAAVIQPGMVPQTTSDRLDRVFTHKVWGIAILLGLLLAVFSLIFYFARFPMDAIDAGFGKLGQWTAAHLPPGELRDLLVDGAIAGVGSVLVFLPQIFLLFFCITVLEDTGYMARASFIMDKVMGKFGLHGKAFIPLLSSFACAVPGIMSARTIEHPKDRLVTILVAPWMCCSARWPVYFLLAAAFVPSIHVLGFIPLPALIIFLLVVLGAVAAIGIAGLFKRTILAAETPALILELPPYRWPVWRKVLQETWSRSAQFLKRAGTVILAISIVLWALATHPRQPAGGKEEQVRSSFAGQMGRAIEPAIRPLGFDWKIGVALVTSFVAREVFVSSMGTIYGIENDDPGNVSLQDQMRNDRLPDGTPRYNVVTGISLMVFYVFAMQCASTVVTVRRETGSWKWAIFQFAYMSAVAWAASFLVWQIGRHLV
ncbi:MAG: ferrous iron transport protein B [Verrucomicrobiae bacterium]|nr:ferrous iron transport protein B [Verrucomicrobiae bacterium]